MAAVTIYFLIRFFLKGFLILHSFEYSFETLEEILNKNEISKYIRIDNGDTVIEKLANPEIANSENYNDQLKSDLLIKKWKELTEEDIIAKKEFIIELFYDKEILLPIYSLKCACIESLLKYCFLIWVDIPIHELASKYSFFFGYFK